MFIKYSFIKAFSKTGFNKVLPIKALLNQFSLTNSQKRNFKILILKLIYELKDYKLIEPQINLVGKSSERVNIDKLTPYKIGNAEYIILFENTMLLENTILNNPEST